MFRCDYCEEERLFEDWRSYRMHCLKMHPGQPARKEAFQPDDTYTESEEEQVVEATPEPVSVIEAPQVVPPYTPAAAPATDITGKAERLRKSLTDMGLEEKKIETIVSSFIGFPDYQSYSGLTRCLSIHLKADSPVAKDPRVILDAVFPKPDAVPAAPSPIDQIGLLANIVTTMAANSAQQSIALSQAVSNLGKGDSNELILKLIEANNATTAAKLDAQAQMSQMLVDVMKAQMETVKAENERLRHEAAMKGERDFEARIFDMIEGQALPAVVGESRELRKAITTGIERISRMPTHGEVGLQRGPISDEESARMIAAEEAREKLRQLARGVPLEKIYGGNGSHEVVSVPQQPPPPPSAGGRYFD